MARRKFTVTVEVNMEIEIEDTVLQAILPDFRKMIDPQADEDDIIEQIGWTIALGRQSGEDFVEGIGSLSEQGIECEEDYHYTSCEEHG